MIFRGKTVSPFDSPQTAVQLPQLKHRPSVSPPKRGQFVAERRVHSVVLHGQAPGGV